MNAVAIVGLLMGSVFPEQISFHTKTPFEDKHFL